jgi:hypothetical protein
MAFWLFFQAQKNPLKAGFVGGPITLELYLVPWAGLEPAQLSPLRPQHSVSTNSTTGANTLITPASRQLAQHLVLIRFPLLAHQKMPLQESHLLAHQSQQEFLAVAELPEPPNLW